MKRKLEDILPNFIAESTYGKMSLTNIINSFNDINLEELSVLKNLNEYFKSCLEQKALLNIDKLIEITDTKNLDNLKLFLQKETGMDTEIKYLLSLTEQNNQFNFNSSLFNQLNRNFQNFIEMLKNDSLNESLSKASIIKINLLVNADQLKEIIYAIAKRSFVNNPVIEVKWSNKILEEERIKIKLDTGLDLRYDSDIDPRKENLIKSFLDQVKGKENFSTDQIREAVQLACSKAKSTDGLETKLLNGLRSIYNFLNSSTDTDSERIKQVIKNIYSSQKIRTESYHIEQGKDKYFVMEKLDESNIHFWTKYIRLQYENRDSMNSDNIQGHIDFKEVLKHFDKDLNEVWVAYFTNKNCNNSKDIEHKSIEMAVSVNTSRDAKFFSPMGIARNNIYEGTKHTNLSKEFLGCIGKVIKEHYSEANGLTPKEILISKPAEIMLEMSIKNYKNCIFVGDSIDYHEKENFKHSLEELYKIKEVLLKNEITIGIKSQYSKNTKKIALNEQKVAMDKEKKSMAITVTGTNEHCNIKDCDESFIFTLKDFLVGNGKVIQAINKSEAGGQYGWFFDNPFAFPNQDTTVISIYTKDIINYDLPEDSIKHSDELECIGSEPIALNF